MQRHQGRTGRPGGHLLHDPSQGVCQPDRLQAADQAQNAESSATTVQMVSVLFSIIIAALLTSAGSIWELSVATVLMYQAAWSALSIAVCALKQHN